MENSPAIASLPEYRKIEAACVKNAAKRMEWLEEGRAAWEDYQRTGLHLSNEEVLDWMDKIIDGEDALMPKCHT